MELDCTIMPRMIIIIIMIYIEITTINPDYSLISGTLHFSLLHKPQVALLTPFFKASCCRQQLDALTDFPSELPKETSSSPKRRMAEKPFEFKDSQTAHSSHSDSSCPELERITSDGTLTARR